MYYVYALLSNKNGDLYIGSTSDLRIRFKEHNDGRVKSTKGYRPWMLVYYEAYRNKNDATQREKQLKGHKAKSDLREQIENSLAK
ncbi:MAG: GIY-YIG nuclease family protein [Candidatus Roizmanbacteria bacterium]|nr:GIY-YIG nuclease family protein [Candidatus Roizmanbacteria bacterium]